MKKAVKNTADNRVSVRETLQLSGRAFTVWSKRWPRLFPAITLAAAASALSPYVPVYLSAQILNELSGARDSRRLTFLVLATLLSTVALALITALLTRWKNIELGAMWHKRRKIYTDKMLSMDFAAADAAYTHELLSQIEQNDNWSGWGIMRIVDKFEQAVKGLLGILGALLLTATLFTEKIPESAGYLSALNNPLLSAAILVLLLAFTFLAPVCRNKATAYWTEFGELIKGFNRVFNYFGYFSRDKERSLDIRMYQQEKISRLYFEKETLFKAGYMVKTTRGPMGLWAGVSGAVSAVFTGLAYAFVCLKAWAGAFGVGSVAQYVGAITALSTHIGALVSAWGELRANAAFLRKTFEFLDIPNEMYQGSLTTEKRSDRNYEIEFRDVSFQYPGSEEYALRHVSVKFRVGERLAVVGQNGSGKTTFIKLLCRLYDPTEGVILLNGIDIRKYDYDEYIALFSVVFQDFKLLAFSLGQNVAASVEYDRDRVQDCLEKAGFIARLEGMPSGIDTNLYKEFDENGVQISGGEAQKIALARALYKDAPFVVLDEPTAALDPIAEMEVYSKFNEIVGDKTAIYISHRLSSCRFCDIVAVFDHGEIVQRGSHDTLVRDEKGKYFELWNAQAQYYV